MRLEDDLKALEAAGCDELRFNVMDGCFAPDFTLGADFIAAVRACCGIPCRAHLMIERPERHIERFVQAGCAGITVHVEACVHAHRTLNQIRDLGISPGIALNPATPLTRVDYLLESTDRVHVMTTEPGYSSQRIVPAAFERVRILKENIGHRRLPALIEVDGDITTRNAAILVNEGARVVDVGRAGIPQGVEPGKALQDFRAAVAGERLLV